MFENLVINEVVAVLSLLIGALAGMIFTNVTILSVLKYRKSRLNVKYHRLGFAVRDFCRKANDYVRENGTVKIEIEPVEIVKLEELLSRSGL